MKGNSRRVSLCLLVLAAASNGLVVAGQQGMVAQNPADLTRVGDKVIKANEAISLVQGFGNRSEEHTSELQSQR